MNSGPKETLFRWIGEDPSGKRSKMTSSNIPNWLDLHYGSSQRGSMGKEAMIWKISSVPDAELERIDGNAPAASLDEAAKQIPGGAYTTFRTFNRYQVIRIQDHFDRLEQTARLAGFPLTVNRTCLLSALHRAISAYDAKEMRVRITLDLEQTPGTIYLTIEPLHVPDPQKYLTGVKVVTRRLHRQNPKAKLTGFIEVASDIRNRLPEDVNEAIMVGDDQTLLEGLSSNFFAVIKGEVWTADQGVLSGLTRSSVIHMIEELHIPLHLEALPVARIPELEEAFITSASRAVLPVVNMDGKDVDGGKPGEITRKLIEAYQSNVIRNLDTL